MSRNLSIHDIDKCSEHAYIDVGGIKIQFVSVKHIGEIADTVAKLGIETDEILKKFKQYDFEYLRNLTSEESRRLIRESSELFILEKEDIKKIRDFCKEAIAKIKEVVDISKRSKTQIVGNEFEEACYEAWGDLNPMLIMCERALELGVRLHVA